MTEQKARKQLIRMLQSYTPGTILHLLGEVFGQEKEEARKAGDEVMFERCRNLEIALLVVGMESTPRIPDEVRRRHSGEPRMP